MNKKDWRERLRILMAIWGDILHVNKGKIRKNIKGNMKNEIEELIEKVEQEAYKRGRREEREKIQEEEGGAIPVEVLEKLIKTGELQKKFQKIDKIIEMTKRGGIVKYNKKNNTISFSKLKEEEK